VCLSKKAAVMGSLFLCAYLSKMPENEKYEAVIGLEVHTQLLTKSKLFCGDSTGFGASPNTQVSPISLAHPGTLPKMNRTVIEYAIKLGIALHCDIERNNYFARKNYFYPDLPKGYQVSQHTTPICKNGFVTINVNSAERNITLNRIHIEEDAGKSLHDVDENYTCIDLNRAGVPLLEIVSEPDMHTADEAFAYLTEIRKLVRYLGICDGNMEEGSMRCDANISIRLRGEQKLGTKVEVKNLNSIRNVKKAIDHEIKRLIELSEKNEPIIQQTRSFDADTETTFPLRTKEEANDYRYFAEPDLTPFFISDEMLLSVKQSIPSLPKELELKYQTEYGLSAYDAKLLCEDRSTSDFFGLLLQHTNNYKAAANWLLGPIRSYLNENNIEINDFPLPAKTIAGLIRLIEEGKINFGIASSKVFNGLLKQPAKEPLEVVTELNLLQESSDDTVTLWVDEVINKLPEKVTEYKKGKKALIGLFAGEVKKLSKGKADMQLVNKILTEKLNQ
jgi:aspartyl-tRNA(Asn)/glutamyl-tRNA(Gln) amidotransferase subunit B